MPNIGKTLKMDVFKGINNVVPADKSLDGYLKDLVNFDIDKSNNLSKRKGYILKDSANYHSLWSDGTRMFAVRNGDLVEIKEDASFTVLESSIGDAKVSYDKVDNTYYYTSKFRNGKIVGSSRFNWGIALPNPSPTVSSTSGSLPDGLYLITTTFETFDGIESGNSTPVSILVSSTNNGISLSNIPVSSDSSIKYVNVYMTTQNGTIFYKVRQYLNGSTSSDVITDMGTFDKELETESKYPPPKGSIVKYAHGRLFIVQDNILWYSEPFQYDLFNITGAYIYFEEAISSICPTQDGIWISSDKMYYLSGKDPSKGRLTEKELVKVIPGSEVKFSGSYVFIDNTPIGYKWLVTTNRGIFILFNDGVILSISEQNVSLPEAEEAAASFIQEDGINRYISLLKNKKDSNNTAIGDMVSSTIVRNGITIE